MTSSSSTVTDKEIEQIERLYKIVKEGSQTTRDFLDAYRAARREEDSRRQQQRKPNSS